MYPWLNDPQQVVARTVWGENRGGGYIGMQSVANVIMNRAKRGGWWGATPMAVCLHPWQFSTWNPMIVHQTPDSNYLATVSVTDENILFEYALQIAQLAIAGALPDLTEGADSYYALSLDAAPAWAKNAVHTMDIAGQSFYKTVM